MERNARYQLIRLVCKDMYFHIADRPEEDQALAVNELIETYLTRGVRLQLRKETFVEREHYVAVRSACHKLRNTYWTAENLLELRLTKYIATGDFRMADKLFSMIQNTDGTWERQALMPVPSNQNHAKQDHIFGALPVPSPFRNPAAVHDAQKQLLSTYDFEVTEDGKGCAIDPFQAASAAIRKARANNNYTEPTPARPGRMQWLCDGVGYFRGGRMACRCGVRIPDVKRRNNSKFYFSNVALFLGPDKYECLATYLETVYAKLNSGLRTTSTGKDERGNEAYSCSLFTDKVGCMDSDLEITDAGDAACANASAAMEPPPSHLGCCSYCENDASTGYTLSTLGRSSMNCTASAAPG